jgi:hypothetical protein
MTEEKAMSARWVVVVALLASGCGGAFDAASSGSDGSTSNDSSLDSPTSDSQGAEGGGGTDGGQIDGRGGGDDSGGQGEGSVDGAPADGGGDAGLDAGQEAGEDSGREAGKDAGPEAGKDAGPEGGVDGGDGGGWSTVCPASAPVAGTMCSDSGLQCEYPQAMYGKVEYDISCDEVVECSGGAWTAASFGGACNPDGANSSECPTSLGAITSGDTCPDKGLRCEYPKGVCSCAVNFGGVVVADAGATWTCEPGAGCPMPRPRLGSACGASTTNPACVYESCSYEQICQNSVWQAELAVCATGVGTPQE